MATQQIEFEAPSGMTLTAKLYASGSDTVAYTASAVTEQTNRKGVYRATFASVAAGTYQLVVTSGTTAVAVWWGYAEDTATTFQFGANAGVIGLEAITSGSIASNAGTELATAVWANATRTITGGTVTTVSDKSGYSLVANTGLGNQTANITGNISGSVGSVASAVTVATNNDKTGYTLTQVFPANFSVLSISAQGAVTSSGSGGSTVVAIAPSAALTNYIEAIMVSQAENPHPLTCPYLAQKTFSISIYSIDAETGDKTAVSMEGKNLEVVFEATSGADLAVINNASITKTLNTVVFTNPVAASTPPNSQRKMTGKWAIREVSTGYPWAFGSWEIIDCAFKDA